MELTSFSQETWDLLSHPQVQSMSQWLHHGQISCLEHSLSVALRSYHLAQRQGLDSRAVARAGLLHDFYLYHKRDRSAHPGIQCFDHPRIALENAKKITNLTKKEENIILSHMWPIGGQLPRSPEAWLVNTVDTLSAVAEFAHVCHPDSLTQSLKLGPQM